MIEKHFIYFLFTISTLLLSGIAFRPCLKFAKRHNIVDHPNKRKLQDHPIPVFGGASVVLGMILPLICAIVIFNAYELWYVLGAIVTLWLIGMLDDIFDLSANLRFILELGIIWILLWQPTIETNGMMINNLGGLWGRHAISYFTAIPLTLVAGVGIINSINLIDGVDGYSSGYGIMVNILFAVIFFAVGNAVMGIVSLITAAALIPFYLHNVFGQKNKMYIGDGGSLVIGFVIAYNVFSILDMTSSCTSLEDKGIGIIPMSLAILCIPVFDTLRVMFARLINGGSPFTPDKTHLHHLFIDMGFSHAGTSTIIILIQLIIVLLWYVSYRIGMSISMQFYLVILCGLLICCGYYVLRWHQKHNTTLWQRACQTGSHTHREGKKGWQRIQQIVDTI